MRQATQLIARWETPKFFQEYIGIVSKHLRKNINKQHSEEKPEKLGKLRFVVASIIENECDLTHALVKLLQKSAKIDKEAEVRAWSSMVTQMRDICEHPVMVLTKGTEHVNHIILLVKKHLSANNDNQRHVLVAQGPQVDGVRNQIVLAQHYYGASEKYTAAVNVHMCKALKTARLNNTNSHVHVNIRNTCPLDFSRC